MKRIIPGLVAVLLVLGVLAVTKGEAALLSWRAGQAEKQTLSALKARLAPHMIVTLPKDAGAGPYPVVLQFHGCAGARIPFQEMWARRAHASGFATVIVDSNRPRGLNRKAALEQVCSGKTLMGQERAGDVLAALDMIGEREDIDHNRIVLTGWSHGAWSIMDFLTMDMTRNRPASVSGAYTKPVPTIAGTVLFYPYCGLGTLTRVRAWQQTPPTLTLLAGADTIVDHKACLTMFDQLQAKKHLSVQSTVYPDTEHAFDDPFIEPDWQHWHNAVNMRDAMARYSAFLNSLGAPSGAR